MVIDRRAAGKHAVYDIAVDDLSTFVANGVAVSNCIGNSGPLPDEIADALTKSDVVACAVLSGNRNFEGRIHPQVKMNFLASPPLVVAYALAGNMKMDLYKEPLGLGKDGKPVYLKDIWPGDERDPRSHREARDVDDVQVELRERVQGRQRTGRASRRRRARPTPGPTIRPT